MSQEEEEGGGRCRGGDGENLTENHKLCESDETEQKRLKFWQILCPGIFYRHSGTSLECMRSVSVLTVFFGSSDMCHKSCRKTVKKKSPSGPFANLLSLCMRAHGLHRFFF